MYVGEKRITNENWEALSEVNTGEEFYIQNTSTNSIRYVVLNTVPDETIKGGIITPYQQLSFKKVAGDLYIKKGVVDGYVVVEKVEG